MLCRLTIVVISVLFAAREALADSLKGNLLESPYALKIGHESVESVSVSWKFKKPANVSLRDVTFVVAVARHDGVRSEYFTVLDREPLRFRVTNLRPSSTYTLTVQAKCANFVDSVPAVAFFGSMKADWARPKITGVSQNDSGDGVDHTVSWRIDTEWSYPRYFNIEYCAPECKIQRAPGAFSEATFPLGYGAPFNVTVIAVYSTNDDDLVSRSSDSFKGYSPIGRPGSIRGVKSVELNGRFIKIGWKSPEKPRGQLTHYNVEIFDPLNPLKKNRKNVTEPSVQIEAPTLIGKRYAVVIKPFNIDHKNISYPGPSTHLRFAATPSASGERIEILERTSDRIRFKLSHKNHNIDSFVEVDSELNTALVEITAQEARVSNLKPYSLVRARARICRKDEEAGAEFCDDTVHFELRSNVKAPSPVRDLRLNSLGGSCYEALWEAPLEPRGPIDGYHVVIANETNKFIVETDKELLRFRGRRFCNPYHRDEGTFVVQVTAFNYDLQNENTTLEGQPASVPLVKREESQWLRTIMAALPGVLMGMAMGRFCQQLTRHSHWKTPVLKQNGSGSSHTDSSTWMYEQDVTEPEIQEEGPGGMDHAHLEPIPTEPLDQSSLLFPDELGDEEGCSRVRSSSPVPAKHQPGPSIPPPDQHGASDASDEDEDSSSDRSSSLGDSVSTTDTILSDS